MKNIMVTFCCIVSAIFSGCNNPTMEKNGGVRVTLAASYSDFIRSIANPDSLERVDRVTREISNDKTAGFKEYRISFLKEMERMYPGTDLKNVIMSPGWFGILNQGSANTEVLQLLQNDWDSAILRSVQVLQKRLDNMEAVNATVRIEKGNSIVVEVPGNADTARIVKILSTRGELGFWETYENAEIFPFLNDINNYLIKIKYKKIEKDTSLIGQFGLTDSTAIKYPLYTLLSPAVRNNELIPGAAFGYVKVADTAEVLNLFRKHEILAFLPRNIKIGICRTKWTQENNIYELIALKPDRQGKPVLDGSVIVDAQSSDKENYSPSINIMMNHEGAISWERITGDNIGKSIAIVLDDVVYSYPRVQSSIKQGNSVITGSFTHLEAKDLAYILSAGMCPLKLFVVKTENVGCKR